ncbi:MAG: conjugal transfer protein TraF [Limnohabitans sp.]|jgi:conjugal transfer pilus assembly protein TraF|uniref:conjugal transfer protein TraF n=1 Tax=Limnohabitans sp. TaxID=1907725 RepID=UPI00391C0DC2
MRRSSPSFLLGVLSSLALPAFAQPTESQFQPFRGDGYYWYKKAPEPVQPSPVKPKEKEASPGPKALPKPLSQAWLRENLPKLLDAAVDSPTPENVSNYMYAQRVLLDKSQNFSEKVRDVVATDPFLDENNRVPIAQFAQPDFARSIKQGQDEVLRYLAGKAGIWVFVDDPARCGACEGYVRDILVGTGSAKGVATQHGFNLRKIDVRTEAGRTAAKRLNLKVTPTTVLVVPPSGFFLVSQGLMSQSQLAERLMIASRASGQLPKGLLDKVNPYNKGVLTPNEMGGIESSAEPSDVMKTLRQRIRGEK